MEILPLRGLTQWTLEHDKEVGIRRLIPSAGQLRLFLFEPVLSMLVQKQLLGYEVSIGGADAITPSYLITLVLFGALILYIRILTRSVWTGIGFHFIFVFMNQLMGPNPDRLIQFTDLKGEQALQLTLIALLIIVFVGLLIYPRIMKKPIGWREKLVLKASPKPC